MNVGEISMNGTVIREKEREIMEILYAHYRTKNYRFSCEDKTVYSFSFFFWDTTNILLESMSRRSRRKDNIKITFHLNTNILSLFSFPLRQPIPRIFLFNAQMNYSADDLLKHYYHPHNFYISCVEILLTLCSLDEYLWYYVYKLFVVIWPNWILSNVWLIVHFTTGNFFIVCDFLARLSLSLTTYFTEWINKSSEKD